MWLVLISPFITALFSFIIVKGVLPDEGSREMKEVWILITGILFSLFMLIGFCICSGIFILSPVSDRENKLRHLLNFVGMKPLAYYLGNLLADLLLFLLPTIAFMIILFPLNIKTFTHSLHLIFLIMMCFGFSLICLTYMVAFLFSNSNTAFRQIGTVYLIIGYFVPNTVGGIVSAAIGGNDGTKVVRYFLLIDPFFPFNESLLYLVFKYAVDQGYMTDTDLSYFVATPTVACISMVATGIVCFVIAVIMDSKRQIAYRN